MKGPKVVVVDDEAAIRRLLKAALERAGYYVVEASTAREAQNAMDIDRPEAVLLDLGLPDREGLELVPLIAKSGAALLVISAREATAEKIAALDLGADDYVTKPFDTDEVLARLRRALRQRVSGERKSRSKPGRLGNRPAWPPSEAGRPRHSPVTEGIWSACRASKTSWSSAYSRPAPTSSLGTRVRTSRRVSEGNGEGIADED